MNNTKFLATDKHVSSMSLNDTFPTFRKKNYERKPVFNQTNFKK